MDIDHTRLYKLLMIEEKHNLHRLKHKEHQLVKVQCDLCNITLSRGNMSNHRNSIQHKHNIAIYKLDQIKDGIISNELIDELKQLLT